MACLVAWAHFCLQSPQKLGASNPCLTVADGTPSGLCGVGPLSSEEMQLGHNASGNTGSQASGQFCFREEAGCGGKNQANHFAATFLAVQP